MSKFECVSPIDDQIVYAGTFSSAEEMDAALNRAQTGQTRWAAMSLQARLAVLRQALQHLGDARQEIGLQITLQMGRPIRFAPNEIDGVIERGETMLEIAETALKPVTPRLKPGFDRSVVREPVGVVAVLAPWNYPFLTSVNAIIPALAAGNSVLLKHSTQTPLVALRYKDAFDAAGLPDGVFQVMFLTHEQTARLVSDARIDHVAFTGSVSGGRAICDAVSPRFIGAGLELGGKDPAYVREDADLDQAAATLGDGAFFNSGQSCCGIERIYVHAAHFEAFVAGIAAYAKSLVLGDPRNPETTLGPMASARGADAVRQQISAATSAGAKAHLPIDENWGSAYLAPQVLTQVDHTMSVMTDESFGPVVGVMPVANDQEALALMNDSAFGLTASIWTRDIDAARRLGDGLETGTVFMNRCDYLDPELAWTGVKDSGRGCTLSALGYEQFTRPKSYHFKHAEEG